MFRVSRRHRRPTSNAAWSASGNHSHRRGSTRPGKQIGLSDAEVREMAAAQLYLSNYLDSRFRPGVQIDPKTVDDFYQKSVVPLAKSRGEEPPPLDAARDLIREALVQRGINDQADQWLIESKARLHIEKFINEAAK